MMPRQNFMVLDADHRTALARGFELMARIIEAETSIKNWIFLIPQKGTLQGTRLSSFLGDTLTKALLGGRTLAVHGAGMRMETFRTMSQSTPADGVIAVYPDQKMMDLVDSNRSIKAVVAIPLVAADVENWKRAWNPFIPGAPIAQENLITDVAVVAALNSLTSRINLSNRVLNPSDAEAVVDAFQILRAHNHQADPAAIRAWCVGQGWDPRGADEAMEHATKVFGSKSKPRIYGTHWADDIYAQWKSSRP